MKCQIKSSREWHPLFYLEIMEAMGRRWGPYASVVTLPLAAGLDLERDLEAISRFRKKDALFGI